MNIKEAKQEIRRTIEAYRRKDETGAPEIPPQQQRPILLIGPPGIGKTAVMQQLAEECGIALAAYTITHHTRQSAIGLPQISRRTYGGQEMTVTEYTMSEIIASIYDKMEQTGKKEGILFLDEINCVSETLAPTMLQFLQYKTFGTHRVPEGWIIVTAGNQPQYNRSAREFDIVTLDRVKKIEIEADLDVWKEYAVQTGLHGSILAYLDLKPQNFYRIRTELDGRHFVTARGWEDLSRMLFSYEKMGEEVTESLAAQYLQDPEIARDFSVYYALYRRYADTYRIQEILRGTLRPERADYEHLPFDEKLGLLRLLTDALHRKFAVCTEREAVQEMIYDRLLPLKNSPFLENARDAAALLRDEDERLRRMLRAEKDAGSLSAPRERILRLVCLAWEELQKLAAGPDPSAAGARTREDRWSDISAWFTGREDDRLDNEDETGGCLENAFSYLTAAFGPGQEMVMFLTALNADPDCLNFLRSHPSPSYDRYNELLLLQDRKEELRRAAQLFL